ncbi:MAG TPA: hypothetical protein VMH83_09015 [Candidatus Acidoferrum sp.]|nr:hypothetical protein [Candidatus Acidoferrum sp.]
MNTEQSAERWCEYLSGAAFAGWLLSLILPGFMVDSRLEPLYGGEILVSGFFFGWLCNGWAVYANLFFLFAGVKLLVGGRPLASVIMMLALAATLPLFSGVPRDEGTGVTLAIVGWGWGAAIWLCSLILMTTAAALRRKAFSPIGAKFVLGLLLTGLVATGVVHFNQRAAASPQEQQLYLNSAIAFTRASLCGIPLTEVTSPLVQHDDIIALDIEPGLNDQHNGLYLSLPKPLNYQEGDFAFVTVRNQNLSMGDVKLRVPASANRPVLQARKTAEGTFVRLLSNPSGRILYEQKLLEVPAVSGRWTYCPTTSRSYEHLKDGYDKNLERALGLGSQPTLPYQRQSLLSEMAAIPCRPGAKNKNGVKDLRDWDGREVMLDSLFGNLNFGFCSDSYIILGQIRDYSVKGDNDLGPFAFVFDRKTLAPIAAFFDTKQCRLKDCPVIPTESVSGVGITDSEIVVETARGDVVAKRAR